MKRSGLEDSPLLQKSITTTENSDSVEIVLAEADTNIGGFTSEVIDYWYEVKTSDGVTLAGYDSSGPKILTLYPKGRGE